MPHKEEFISSNGKKIEIVKGKDNVKQIIITRKESAPSKKDVVVTPALIAPKPSIDSLVAGLLTDDIDLEMPGGFSHHNSVAAVPLGNNANHKSDE